MASAPKAPLSGSAPPPVAPPVLAKSSTAILVIHGIGEQNPYETLDQFARNLYRHLREDCRIADITLTPYRIDHNDWVGAFVRLQSNSGPNQGKYIDVHEFYWAPLTEGKMSYKEVLSWLVQSTLRTIKRFEENVKIQQGTDSRLTKGAIILRELFRICLLYLPLLGSLGLLYAWLANADVVGRVKTILQNWKQLIRDMGENPWGVALWCFLVAMAIVFSYIALGQLWRLLLRRHRRARAVASSWWALAVGVSAALSALAAHYLFTSMKIHLTDKPGESFLRSSDYLLLGSALLGATVRAFLTKFVADVAIYTNADAKAKNYTARQQIMAGAMRAVRSLLEPQQLAVIDPATHEVTLQKFNYEQVILAGHSLGTVVTYDAINNLCNHEGGSPDPIDGKAKVAQISPGDLAKITGLVTFGSPLDKVYYFFRDSIPVEQSVRAQILSYLHSFRKRGSGRDYDVCRFNRYLANDLPNCRWFNAWSIMDPVSGKLHFYDVDYRKHFWYLIPIYAHLSYWEDRRFYAFFASPLLLAAAPQQPRALAAYV